MKYFRSGALPAALVLLACTPALADDRLWNGGDGIWLEGDASGWDAAWLNGDSAVFSGTPGWVTLNGPVTADRVTVEADDYGLSSADVNHELRFTSWEMSGGALAVDLDGSLRIVATAADAFANDTLLRLHGDAELRTEAAGATGRHVSLSFDASAGGGGGAFALAGGDTTLGAISSQSIGAGRIFNAGSAAANLALDFDDDYHEFSGIVEDGSSALGLTKSGTGALVLSGANSYSGGTVLNDGLLVIANATALGSGVFTIEGGSIAIGGPDDIALANDIHLNGDLTIQYPTDAGGYLDLNGTITLSGDRTIFNDDDVYFAGDIVEGATPSALTLRGQGTYGLAGNNTFSGGLTVYSRLMVDSETALGSGTVTFESAGPLDAGGSLSTQQPELTLANDMILNAPTIVERGGVLNLTGRISGVGSLVFFGTSTTVLSGDNSYEFPTFIVGGQVVANHDHALGIGPVLLQLGSLYVPEGVTIGNEVFLAEGTYSRTLSGSLAHAIDSTSSFGEVDTHAALLAGELSVSTTLTTSFCTCGGAVNEELRMSDIYHFDGTGSDLFVLSLTVVELPTDAFLGWLNADSEWVAAVLGNSGNNATEAMKDFEGSFEDFQELYGTDLNDYIGASGRDAANGSVWAVLNHNSEFAVMVPETGSVLLALLGLLALVRRTR